MRVCELPKYRVDRVPMRANLSIPACLHITNLARPLAKVLAEPCQASIARLSCRLPEEDVVISSISLVFRSPKLGSSSIPSDMLVTSYSLRLAPSRITELLKDPLNT